MFLEKGIPFVCIQTLNMAAFMFISKESKMEDKLSSYASEFGKMKLSKVNLLLALNALLYKGRDVGETSKAYSSDLCNSLNSTYR
jgi:hypothetical protein